MNPKNGYCAFKVYLHVIINTCLGNSLAVQWLELRTLTAEGQGSIPDRGTKIPQAGQRGQKKQNKTKNTLVSAILHPAFACTIQTYEVEVQAIPFTVSPLPPNLGIKGIFRKEDDLNSIEELSIDQIAAKVNVICSQK